VTGPAAGPVPGAPSAPGRREVVVVVPAFNEEPTVGRVVRELVDAGLDCVVVDDGSADATAERAREAGATVVRLPFNLGIGGSLRCGFRYAVAKGYRVVVQCDADGQHVPAEIEALLEAQRSTGAHLVVGSRFLGREAPTYRVGRVRRLAMRMLTRVVQRSTGLEMTDTTSGFRCVARPLLDAWADDYPAQYMESLEALIASARAGYRIVEVPAGMHEREAGVPSAGAVSAAKFMLRVFLATAVGLGYKVRPLDATADPGSESAPTLDLDAPVTGPPRSRALR
jgi:glycosyltransferase involved in cell wall biosynthesis